MHAALQMFYAQVSIVSIVYIHYFKKYGLPHPNTTSTIAARQSNMCAALVNLGVVTPPIPSPTHVTEWSTVHKPFARLLFLWKVTSKEYKLRSRYLLSWASQTDIT